MSKKIWFKNKSYGYGWTPATKEGWLVILVFLLILIIFEFLNFGLIQNKVFAVAFHIVFILLWSGALIYIAFKKGEKIRWQWGGKPIRKKS